MSNLRTPSTHPRPKTLPARTPSQQIDRFIPFRTTTPTLQTTFSLLRTPENTSSNLPPPSCYSAVLKSELLDTPPPPAFPAHRLDTTALPSFTHPAAKHSSIQQPPIQHAFLRRSAPSTVSPALASPPAPNLLRFSAPAPSLVRPSAPSSSPFCLQGDDARRALLSSSVLAPGRQHRKIPRAPFKVLDAPNLKDDFYLNLVDWSANNLLAVGLGECVYLWSACTSVVTKLCDLQFGGPVCSVAWDPQGARLAIGTMPGSVQVWDAATGKLVRTLSGHTARAGCLAWGGAVLSSGSRDKDIYNRDLRCRESFVARLGGHKSEVCGLKWSHDDNQLASGGNDNKLLIWNAAGLGSGGGNVRTGSGVGYNSPVLRFGYHEAAVKAIAWSPHARGLLCSGGGTADRKIRFCNTRTNSVLASVDTGSQVCNLIWSKNVNEVVSTHGYSQNQIIVWKYPTLAKVVTLMGHSSRVLYLSMSPSGETIVTGAGDETLRFWNVFPAAKFKRGGGEGASKLSPSRMCIR